MKIIMRGGYRPTGQPDDEAQETRRRLQAALGLTAAASVPGGPGGVQRQPSLSARSGSPAASALANSSAAAGRASLPAHMLAASSTASAAPFPSLHPHLPSPVSGATGLLGSASAAANEPQLPQLAMLLQEQRMASTQGAHLEAQLLHAQAQAQAQAQVQAQIQAQETQLRMRALLEQENAQTEEQLRVLRLRRQQQQLQDELLLRTAYSELQNPRPQPDLRDRLLVANSSNLSVAASAAAALPPGVAGLPSAALVGDTAPILPGLASQTGLSGDLARRAAALGLPAGDGAFDSRRLALTNTGMMDDSLTGKIMRLESEGAGDIAFQPHARGHVAAASASLQGSRVGLDADEMKAGEMKSDDRRGERQGSDISDDEYFRTHKNPRDVQPSAEDIAANRRIKRSREPFPLKLYRILYEAEKNGQAHIVSFFPHGKAFAVHKPQEFIRDIMPKYFAAGRMNTFLKQLNLYSFQRITEGPDKGGYFHPEFVRGKRRFHKKIKRKKTNVPKMAENDPSGRMSPSATDVAEAQGAMSPSSTSSADDSVEPSGMDVSTSTVARLPALGAGGDEDDDSPTRPQLKKASSS